MGGVWFVKMGGGTSGRCVVCMGDGVKIGLWCHMIKQMGNGNDKV